MIANEISEDIFDSLLLRVTWYNHGDRFILPGLKGTYFETFD